jgi:hypothetical protein
MDIRQLLDPLLLRPNIEVVVSRLPHKLLHPRLREPLFQSLHSDRQQSRLRLTHQQMDVSRHHHIPKDMHRIKYTSPLQQLDEAIPSLGRLKNPAMPKTTDRNVMEIAGLLIALKTCWHCEECSRGEERCRASAQYPTLPRKRRASRMGHPGLRQRLGDCVFAKPQCLESESESKTQPNYVQDFQDGRETCRINCPSQF